MHLAQSLPVRGAWIEIDLGTEQEIRDKESLPVRGAWIEISNPSMIISLY